MATTTTSNSSRVKPAWEHRERRAAFIPSPPMGRSTGLPPVANLHENTPLEGGLIASGVQVAIVQSDQVLVRPDAAVARLRRGRLAVAQDERSTAPPISGFGRALFFDSSLSADGKISCATCHRPDYEFAEPRAVSQGTFGLTGTRNAPSLLARQPTEPPLWDGRRDTLESQVLAPLTNPVEHGLADFTALTKRLAASPNYLALLGESFGLWLTFRKSSRSRLPPRSRRL